MKALEVRLARRRVGVFVPPAGGTFSVMLANVPQTYMRAFVTAGNGHESFRWQLPDTKEGERLTFRMIDVAEGTTGAEPHEVEAVPAKERKRLTTMARRAYARAMAEKAAQERPIKGRQPTRKKHARG